MICELELTLPDGSRILCMIQDAFPGLDILLHRSSKTSHNGGLGSTVDDQSVDGPPVDDLSVDDQFVGDQSVDDRFVDNQSVD